MTRPKLHIGANLFLPYETQTSTILALGGKGMGKTNLGRVIDEELSRAGLRWAALDPLGVWWGLRYSKDGKGPGIECLILGGVHGDMPIEPTGGAVVADLVVDETISVIIDFSRKPSGEMWGIGEKTRFLTDYAKRLYQRQGELVNGHRREPIFQMLDEAARYVPQLIPHGNPQLAECLGAWETLVEEGRNIGIGVGLLTQRSARINKSVSELADALFAFRTVGPNSVEAVTDWLGAHVPKDKIKAHIETLRSLERGRCLVVSPGWLQFDGIVDIRAGNTFDSSATPKPGERAHKVHGAGAKPDLEKYQQRMKETIERARENDPKALRAQIAQMKAELAKAPKIAEVKSVATNPNKAEAIRQGVEKSLGRELFPFRGAMEEAMKVIAKVTAFGFEATKINPKQLEDAVKKAVEEIGKQITTANEIKRKEFDLLKHQADVLLKRLENVLDKKLTVSVDVIRAQPPFVLGPSTEKESRVPRITHPRPAASSALPAAAGNGNSSEALDKGEKAILLAAAQCHPADRVQLSIVTGYKKSTRNRYIQFLQAKGLLEVKGDKILPTPEGMNALGSDYEPLPTGERLQRYWLNRLPEGEKRILKFVLESGGAPVDRDAISDATGYKKSTRNRYIQFLQARHILEAGSVGAVKPVAMLFDGDSSG